ncbi:T-cell receptor alpha [Solea senegalensis]|nr:T-cell receptor alpha [Solea senegalensis]
MLSLHHSVFSLLLLNTLTGINCEELTPVKTEEFTSEHTSVSLSYKYHKSADANDNFFWYRQHPGKPPEFLIYISGSNFTKPADSLKKKRFFTQLSEDKHGVKLQINSAAVTDSAVYYCAVRPTVTGNTTTLYKNTTSTRGSEFENKSLSHFTCYFNIVFFYMSSLEDHLSTFEPLESLDIRISYSNGMNYIYFAAMCSMNSIKPESSEEVVPEGGNIKLSCKYEGSINNIQWFQQQQQRSRPEFLLLITEDGFISAEISGFSAHINKTDKRVDLRSSQLK